MCDRLAIKRGRGKQKEEREGYKGNLAEKRVGGRDECGWGTDHNLTRNEVYKTCL